jgi:hypothetical protein
LRLGSGLPLVSGGRLSLVGSSLVLLVALSAVRGLSILRALLDLLSLLLLAGAGGGGGGILLVRVLVEVLVVLLLAVILLLLLVILLLVLLLVVLLVGGSASLDSLVGGAVDELVDGRSRRIVATLVDDGKTLNFRDEVLDDGVLDRALLAAEVVEPGDLVEEPVDEGEDDGNT